MTGWTREDVEDVDINEDLWEVMPWVEGAVWEESELGMGDNSGSWVSVTNTSSSGVRRDSLGRFTTSSFSFSWSESSTFVEDSLMGGTGGDVSIVIFTGVLFTLPDLVRAPLPPCAVEDPFCESFVLLTGVVGDLVRVGSLFFMGVTLVTSTSISSSELLSELSISRDCTCCCFRRLFGVPPPDLRSAVVDRGGVF